MTERNKKRSRAAPQPQLVPPFDKMPVDIVRRMVQFLPFKQRVLATAHIFTFDSTKGWAFTPDQVFDATATALFDDVAQLQTAAVRSESILQSLTIDSVEPFPPETVWRTWLAAPRLRKLHLVYSGSHAQEVTDQLEAFARALGRSDVARLRDVRIVVDDASNRDFAKELVRILSRPERNERQMVRLDLDTGWGALDCAPLVQAGFLHLTHLRLFTAPSDALFVLIHRNLPSLVDLELSCDANDTEGWPSSTVMIPLIGSRRLWQRVLLRTNDEDDFLRIVSPRAAGSAGWTLETKNKWTAGAAGDLFVDMFAAMITGLGVSWASVLIGLADDERPEDMVAALGGAAASASDSKWRIDNMHVHGKWTTWSEEKQPLMLDVRETTMRLMDAGRLTRVQIDNDMEDSSATRMWVSKESLDVGNVTPPSVLAWLELAPPLRGILIVEEDGDLDIWGPDELSLLVQRLSERKDRLRTFVCGSSDVQPEGELASSAVVLLNEDVFRAWLGRQEELEILDLNRIWLPSIQEAFDKYLARCTNLRQLHIRSETWRASAMATDMVAPPWAAQLTALVVTMYKVDSATMAQRDVQTLVQQFPRLEELQFRVVYPDPEVFSGVSWLELLAPLQHLSTLVIPYFSGVTLGTVANFHRRFPKLVTLCFRCHHPRPLQEDERYASPLDVENAAQQSWAVGGVFVTVESAFEEAHSIFNMTKRLPTRLVEARLADESKLWPTSFHAVESKERKPIRQHFLTQWIDHFLSEQPWANLGRTRPAALLEDKRDELKRRFWILERDGEKDWPVLLDTKTWGIEILNPRPGLHARSICDSVDASFRYKPQDAPATHLVPGWPNTWFVNEAINDATSQYPWSKERNGNGLIMSALYVLLRVLHPNVPPERIGQALHCGQRVACYDAFATFFWAAASSSTTWHPLRPPPPPLPFAAGRGEGDSKDDVKMESVALSGDRVTTTTTSLARNDDYYNNDMSIETIGTHQWRLHLPASGRIVDLTRRRDRIFVRGWQPEPALRPMVLAAMRAWLRCSWLQMSF